MFNGGNVTVMVTDMDRAVGFYTGVLGLELKVRYGNGYAEVLAGPGLTIALHMAGPRAGGNASDGSASGAAVSIGLMTTVPLEEVIEQLGGQGVTFKGPIVDNRNQEYASPSSAIPTGTRSTPAR